MNRRLAGLTAVAAVLGGYLILQGVGFFQGSGGGDAPVPGAVAPRTTPVKLNPLLDLNAASFTAIVERPLFNPSRQPRPEEPVAPPEPAVVEQPEAEPPPPPLPQGPAPGDYKLLGVAAGPDGRIAALRIVTSGEVVYLRQGESVDSWTVVDVGDRSVEIGTPESPVTFSLFENVDSGTSAGEDPSMSDEPAQDQPLPLPLPMPKKQAPPGQPQLPEQHTLPPDTGG